MPWAEHNSHRDSVDVPQRLRSQRPRWSSARCLLLLGMLAASPIPACTNAAERAPPPDEESEGEERDDDLGDLIADDEDESRYCSETSVELPIIRHNFYFVLDASGSMSDIMPGSGGQSRHWAARHAIANMLAQVGHRVNFGAAVFPAPESSDGCAAGAEVFAVREGIEDPNGGLSSSQLDALLFTLGKHSPDGATPTSPTLKALRPSLEALGPKTHVLLLTDGAPNCDLEEGCPIERCIPNIEGMSLGPGYDCDDELNCCAIDLLPHLCLDDDDTLSELEQLREAGVETYVIGIPGSETYADVLDRMALAAGTSRRSSADERDAEAGPVEGAAPIESDAGTDYYRVDDVEELATTLTTLGEELSLDCNIELAVAPERPSLVRVLADDELLEESVDWDWTSASGVLLIDQACATWKSGKWDQIRVVEGCEVLVR